MSNLDGVINKAKSFINIAGKKTGDMFELSKSKIEQINKEADLQKKYELLGKVCYLEYKSENNKSEDMKQIIDDIEKLETEIRTIRENISVMKNIKTCRNCGNKNNKQSIFCSLCGSPLYPEKNYNSVDKDEGVVEIKYNEEQPEDISVEPTEDSSK